MPPVHDLSSIPYEFYASVSKSLLNTESFNSFIVLMTYSRCKTSILLVTFKVLEWHNYPRIACKLRRCGLVVQGVSTIYIGI